MTDRVDVENTAFRPSRDAVMSVARKMANDEDLRNRAAAGDAPALLSELGIDVPSTVKVKILLDEANVRHLVIRPAALDDSGREPVSDEELEGVAGGYRWGESWGHDTADSGGSGWWNDPNRY